MAKEKAKGPAENEEIKAVKKKAVGDSISDIDEVDPIAEVKATQKVDLLLLFCSFVL